MNWLQSLKKWALAPTPLVEAQMPKPVVDEDPMVKAPIRGFVKTVLASPKRFRCRSCSFSELQIRYGWINDHRCRAYKITDRAQGLEFIIMYSDGRLYHIEGIDFNLNAWERNYLHDKLSPVFLRVYDRQQRLHMHKGNKARALAEIEAKKKREKWTAIYGE